MLMRPFYFYRIKASYFWELPGYISVEIRTTLQREKEILRKWPRRPNYGICTTLIYSRG